MYINISSDRIEFLHATVSNCNIGHEMDPVKPGDFLSSHLHSYSLEREKNVLSLILVQVVFFFYFLLKVGYENQRLAKETGDPMPFLPKYCCSILLYFRLAVY